MDIDQPEKENRIPGHHVHDLRTEKINLSRIDIAGVVLLSILSSFALPLMFGGGNVGGGDFLVFSIWIGSMSFAWIFILIIARAMGWGESFWIGAIPGYFVATALILSLSV